MRPRRSTRLGFQPPAIGEEEIAAVVGTLRSGWLTTGPRAALLEERMAAYLEAEHVLALASGTAALHLALLAVGVGPGDEVIVLDPCYDCYEPAIDLAGGKAVHVALDPLDFSVDWQKVREAVAKFLYDETHRRPLVLPVAVEV